MCVKVKVNIFPATQQWVKSLRRNRMDTIFIYRMKEFLDFAKTFCVRRIEMRLGYLNLFLVKQRFPVREIPRIKISPVINMSLASMSRSVFYTTLFKSTALSKLTIGAANIPQNQKPLIHRIDEGSKVLTTQYIKQGFQVRHLDRRFVSETNLNRNFKTFTVVKNNDTHTNHGTHSGTITITDNITNNKIAANTKITNNAVTILKTKSIGIFNPLTNRIFASERLIDRAARYKYRPIFYDPFPGKEKNAKRFRDESRGEPVASKQDEPSVLNRVYTGNHSKENSCRPLCGPGRDFHFFPGKMVSRALTEKQVKFNILQTFTRIDSAVQHFYRLLQRGKTYEGSIIHVYSQGKPKAGTAIASKKNDGPEAMAAGGGKVHVPVVPAALERVSGKTKKIEKQLNIEEVEKTIYRKLFKQVEQTIRQGINKRLAFDSNETRKLTENIYSQIMNRLILEKERMRY